VDTVADNEWNKSNPNYSTSYSYDSLGRVLDEKVPFENANGTIYYSVKRHYYDLNGNIAKELVSKNKPSESSSFNQTTYEYNNRNMLVKVVTYNSGAAVNYAQYYYDAIGNKLRMYTGLSKPLTINGLDNIVTNGDTDYSVTKYQYNQFNQLTRMTDPLGKTESYSYDYSGNMTGKQDRNGNITSFTPDALNRELNRAVTTVQGAGNAAYTTAYTLTGAVKTTAGGGISSSFVYDSLGRLTKETDSKGITKEYSYDAANNRKSMVVKQNDVIKENTTYLYDNMNRLEKVLENGQEAAVYSYDCNSNRATLTYANGNSTEYQYNLANKLVRMVNKEGTAVLSEYTYTYYLDVNQASKTETGVGTTTYVYDGLGRLASVTEPGNIIIVYRYDDNNNRKTMTITGGLKAGTMEYLYDKNNRLLTETKVAGTDTFITAYNYDNKGNQISKSTETIKPLAAGNIESFSLGIAGLDAGSTVSFYEYDGFNQLIKAIEGDKTITYSYNSDGLRNSKTVNGAVTTHVWDGDQIVLEYNGSGAVTNKYVRGINLIYAETGANRRYYLFNGHGDVVQLTGSDGSVTKRYEYDTFGNEKNIDATDTNVFGYCSEYFDKETGTIYLRARYYDTAIGRFISEDSYWGKDRDPLSLNLYTYCYNSPINLWDPSGHYTEEQGKMVHVMIGIWFKTMYGKNARAEYYIRGGLELTVSGTGWADLAYMDEKRKNAEVYEIKPISYKTNLEYNEKGKAQLADYVQAMSKLPSSEYKTVTVGGSHFNPNGVILPCPWDIKRVIVLYTNSFDPGMIYYTDREIRTSDQKEVSTVPGYSTVFDNQVSENNSNDTNSDSVKGTTAIASVATILFWIISEGSRIFPPRNLVPIL
jgi:RHS repeat-associated protein